MISILNIPLFSFAGPKKDPTRTTVIENAKERKEIIEAELKAAAIEGNTAKLEAALEALETGIAAVLEAALKAALEAIREATTETAGRAAAREILEARRAAAREILEALEALEAGIAAA